MPPSVRLVQRGPWGLSRRAWEVAVCLATLRAKRVATGQVAGAYALLAPIYSWFTEGFDMADIQEAKALLEELA